MPLISPSSAGANVTGSFSGTITSSVLPTGAATSALQTTGNTTLGTLALESGGHLANIDTEIGSHLGNIDTNTTGLATQATLASVKTDLDSINTHTTPGTTTTIDVVSITASTTIGNQSATVRKYLLIKALSTNTDTVFVKNGTATVAHGYELAAGDQTIITTQEAMSGIANSGTQKVCFQEVV